MHLQNRILAVCAAALLLSPAGHAQEPASADESGIYEAQFMAHPTRLWWHAGDLPVAVPDHHMAIVEVNRFPERDATPDEQRAADDLVQRALRAAKERGWFDFARGSRDGFELMFSDNLHYAKTEYILDGRVLDPEHPEMLLYYDTGRGKKLAGVMFLVNRDAERGPQIAGPLTPWHYHVWSHNRCLLNRLPLVGDPRPDGRCAVGDTWNRTPEMLHVWFLDHPDGPFATDMALSPELIRQLAERKED